VAAVAFAAATPSAAMAGELQWRSGRTAVRSARIAASSDGIDTAVEAAVFEEARSRSGLGEGFAQFRSVVIEREDRPDVLRSAQLPSSPDGSSEGQAPGAGVPPAADQSAPMPDQLPPLDAQPEDLDMPPQPEDETLQLAPRQQPPAGGQPPSEFQPSVPPEAAAPLQPLPERVPTPSAGTMEAERDKSEQACEQGLSDLQAKTIDTLNLSISVTGDEGTDYPFECSFEEDRWHEGRCWEQTTYLWKASALCHKPLLFEDEQLERYGHSWSPCCQPLVSSAHFFTRLPILPYCMGVEPPNECIYALGHYRPGSCAPYMCNPVPLSFRGALFQAGAVVGAAAALP
jgi:hypothetical protein